MPNINISIPFNRPYLSGKELYYIAKVVIGGHTSGDGAYTKKCQKFLENKFDAKKILLTHSCTAALEMAALLCEVGHGDEVILPSFTFVTTANAFYLRGAKPVFVDINKDTLNIDENKIERAITKKTKVIVPVHYAGVSCNMDYIMQIARKNNIFVVEDAAQAVNAKYKDKYLGTMGDIGAYSFHETKNYICGEGGAIVLNNLSFIERAEIIREKGTDRSKFFRGEIDKYTWVDVGSSYLPSDILSAFLFAQLENMEQINVRRENLFNFYYKELMPLANDGKLRLPYISSECTSNCHLFYIILEDELTRNNLMDYLKSKGILAVFHYLPLHLSKIGLTMGYKKGQFPVTESMSSRLLRLPFFLEMSDEERLYIIESIKSFFK
jgi:dTDP-4-amino-4,6-dideoxygalactose transaminase